MVFFPNRTAELWQYNEAETVDVYGEPIETYTKVGEYPVDFQIKSTNEIDEEYGEIYTDTYKAYFDINTPITSDMLIRLQGEPYTYEVIGSVIKNDHNVLNHIKVELGKQRKPTPLGGVA